MESLQLCGSPESVIRHYSNMVYRLAFARTGNISDAEDLYQEVFLRYLTKAPSFTSEEHRKAWLLRVTVNCANRFHSSLWRKRTEPLSEALAFPAPEGGSYGRKYAACRKNIEPFCISTTTKT